MPRALLVLAWLLAALVPAAAQRNEAAAWAAVRGPSSGPPQIVGGTGLGCLGGAVALPTEGPGWQAVRVSRNRHWGHPSLIAFLRDFAGRARAQGFQALWIGDMSQPRGGPMPWGHASHQVGLDADIWLDLSTKPELPAAARESIPEISLVLPDETGVDRRIWRPLHAALIRLAAESPGVDRVLVNHAIKRELCRTDRGAAWLQRVRPWRGHDSHMHVRLRCPPGQPECRGLPPPPPGDGCDASLEWWLTPEARHPQPRPPGPAPRLPAACAGVLSAR
ncbi:penicillin-insensitive murein endopeptidase [Siccirubricoccus sp. KC 17139]|uniref:Penicillin-insensitive murein endopeptidase n=1 Tax=Siccirubricoccus soli TaxID=2899147 RepID=A0ABT1D5P6_9PROT|nr:penicillin-insensitive murein endopeptidase [Siccirubricoccus soli]MCO6417248.1 penicillin-insensitive murein endopeptidase [Siccirubricoccus soli]MCP2683383.1 penicillin-insensitive murein endopeptidase [Siccirubricoccus soli]